MTTRTPTGSSSRTFKYADPMTTADRVIVFRYMIHSLAADAGMLATFMPKPFPNLTGNGLHMHLSMWDEDDTELFADPSDSRGLGMSAMGYSFIAGLLEHAQALAAVACPTVNSYKRLASPAPDSGAAWSPVFATYGGNDRTHMLRVPDPGRVEDRCIDGSANPYLTISALIAAGLDGIERELNPGRPVRAQPAQAHRAGGGRARAGVHADDPLARARAPRSRSRPAGGLSARPPKATTSTTSWPPSEPRSGPRTPRSRPGSSITT